MENFNVPTDEIRAQVLDFMRELDCYPAPRDVNLILDGKLHRYHIDGDKISSQNGAYCIHVNGRPAGFVQSWKTGIQANWKFNIDNSAVPKEVRDWWNSPEYQKEAEKKQQQRDKEIKERQAKASENAKIQFQNYVASTEIQHPYLTRKNINAYGARFFLQERKIAVPLFNINGNIQSLQWIDADGNKLFYPGAPLAGAFFPIGLSSITQNDLNPILICEGFATGAKIHQLTGLPTACAMTCENIANVAKAIEGKFKGRKIFIMADDDMQTMAKRGFNPGIRAAQNAVNSGLATAFIPPPFDNQEQGTDWDDYALAFGDSKAREAIFKQIHWWSLTEKERQEENAKLSLSENIHTLDPSIQLPPQEFIGGLFPVGFITLLAAPPGTGKTMFIQKSVSDLSIGGNFFDGFSEDEPPRKCLIFAGEAGYELLVRRGASLKWKINPKNVPVVDQHEFEIKDIPIMLDNPEGWRNVERLVEMYTPDIVIWDTFSSFHDADENKSREIKPLIRKIAKLCREKNLAAILVHHSRKRSASERNLSLNQDDVIGTSIFNRFVGLIIGIEPMKDDEKTLLVRPLKTWFNSFMPFTYKITQDLYGHPAMETDLAPDVPGNPKVAVWNYLIRTFSRGEWFSTSQIIISEIETPIADWQLRRILDNFVKTRKLERKGAKKFLEFSIPTLPSN